MGQHAHTVHIVYTLNPRHLLPPSAPRAAAELRQRLRRPLVLHASARWLSAKIFGHVGRDEALQAAREALGPVIAYREGEPPTGKKGLMTRCYLGYIRANMFWEAHAVGEAIWAEIGLLGRALAVAAGAFAKTQEGNPSAASRMMEKAATWLRSEGASLDTSAAREAISRLYREGWVNAAPLLSPAVREAARRLGEEPPP